MSSLLFLAPDPLQQTLVGQHPLGVGRKPGQQPVLQGQQGDRASPQRRPALGEVNGKVDLKYRSLPCLLCLSMKALDVVRSGGRTATKPTWRRIWLGTGV